jgi:hypothetical protein
MYTLTSKQWQALGWSLAIIVVVIIILLIVFLRKKNNGEEESSPPPDQSTMHPYDQQKEQEGTLRPIPSYMPRADDSLPEMPFISAPPRPGMESHSPSMPARYNSRRN